MTKQQRFEEHAHSAAEAMKGGVLALHSLFEGMLPLPSPRRGKRHSMPIEERMVFVEAVHSFHIAEPTADLSHYIAEAIKTGNRRTFEIIAAASNYAKNTPRTQFSETVIAARKSALSLKAATGQWPTKKAVREAVIAKMKSATFGADESSRWTEVFKYAGLGFLPTGKPKRGPSRNR
jgi:hypothetical protein